MENDDKPKLNTKSYKVTFTLSEDANPEGSFKDLIEHALEIYFDSVGWDDLVNHYQGIVVEEIVDDSD